MIQNVGPQFTQWDTGRSVRISDSNATHVHFANQGDSKAVIIEITEGSAKVPDYLFQTGKTLLVYAVLDGVTLESKSFAVRKRERPENYIYDEDQRNFIYELITNAENAIEEANTAAEIANKATENASKATASATAATLTAGAAANSANLAADSANKAATKAAHTAKSLMVVGKAEGEVIALDDAIDQFLVGCRIFGKTTQDGTPTPDAPVNLVSVGDSGSITVNVTGENDTQSITVATPNGLPGIPVSSGGNYTDANGQQWICDEIDCERRKLIVRVLLDVITKTLTFTETEDRQGRFVAHDCVSAFCKTGYDKALSNFAEFESWGYGYNGECFAINSRSLYYYPETEMTADEVTAMFANMVANGTPPVVMGQLRDPIEIDLTDAEFAAYAALHTYRDYTTVSNDASAYMELEYVMDAKKYIDSMMSSPVARLSNVTILASKWTGADGLYSQVVTIDGITPYSKVDLLPSVEQLAIFHNKDVAFVTENEDGVVTVFAIGTKPTNDYTMQIAITEVEV